MKAFGHAVMGRADVIFDTLYTTLVTPPTIRYRRAHGDARRGFRGGADADRGRQRGLVAAHGGTAARAARLAVSVRTGADPRGARAGASGRGGRALRTAAEGGEGRPFPCGFAEVAARQEPGQARDGRRGGDGSPPRGGGRAVLPGGDDAAGEVALASRRRFAQAQHDHVAAHGSLPVARSLAGVGSREGYGRTSAWRHPPVSQRRAGAGNQEGDDQSTAPGGRFPEPGERPAAQGAGAVAGAEGRAGGVAQEGRGASQVETAGTGVAAPGERPVAQGAGTRAQAEGHDQDAARGSRVPEPRDPWTEAGEPQAAPRSGTVARPQDDRTPDDRRGQDSPRGAGRILRPDGPHRFAEEPRLASGSRPEDVCHPQGGVGGRACRTSPAQRGLQETARSGQDHRVAAQGDHAAAQGERTAGQED